MSQTMHPRKTCNKSKFLIFTSFTKRLYNGKSFDFSDLRLFQMWGKLLYKKHINSNADRGPNILGRAKVNEQHFLIPGHHLGWYAVHRLVVQERDKALEVEHIVPNTSHSGHYSFDISLSMMVEIRKCLVFASTIRPQHNEKNTLGQIDTRSTSWPVKTAKYSWKLSQR